MLQEESIVELQHSNVTETGLFSSRKEEKKRQGRETDEGEKKNTFVIQYK